MTPPEKGKIDELQLVCDADLAVLPPSACCFIGWILSSVLITVHPVFRDSARRSRECGQGERGGWRDNVFVERL
jgi:hypothetical protein